MLCLVRAGNSHYYEQGGDGEERNNTNGLSLCLLFLDNLESLVHDLMEDLFKLLYGVCFYRTCSGKAFDGPEIALLLFGELRRAVVMAVVHMPLFTVFVQNISSRKS